MPNLLARWRAIFRPQVYFYSLGSDAPTQVLNYTAQRLYQSQDNLKAVVDFLAASIAQLPLDVYVRKSETDRVRDRTSPAAKLLWLPNKDQTEFEFVRALMTEYFVYGTVYVLVLPDADSKSGWQMWIVPSEWVTSTKRENAYYAESITVVAGQSGHAVEIPRENYIQFRTYSPGNPSGYISPISALRQTLEEQIQAGKFRKQLWGSSGRLNAQIIRPANVAPWDDEQRKKFITAFREAWGPGGSKAGSIPIMEDGMEIKPFSTSFKESQWMESVKLSREACAAAYGVNPSLIWHTDTQTYASSKDNARALYAECLGPVLQMLQQRINSFLLPMVGADENTYVEFDLTEKLKGSFEERASILQAAVGGPWMTRNEARADNNLPPVEGGDELIVPLNVIEGGQASPQDTHMDAQEPMAIEENAAPKMLKKAEAEKFRVKARSTKEEDEAMAAVLKDFWKHQANVILPKLGAKAARWWDDDRWNKELADDIEPLINKIADAHGEEVAKAIGSEYRKDQTRKYLRTLAEGRAKAINESTRRKLEEAIEDEEETPAHVFEVRENKDSITFGRSLAIGVAGWAATHEAPQQAQQQGIHKTVEKRWITGENPRPEHAAMNGQTVPIDEPFSNGCDWPGDENGDPDTTCGCNCSTEVIITVL